MLLIEKWKEWYLLSDLFPDIDNEKEKKKNSLKEINILLLTRITN